MSTSGSDSTEGRLSLPKTIGPQAPQILQVVERLCPVEINDMMQIGFAVEDAHRHERQLVLSRDACSRALTRSGRREAVEQTVDTVKGLIGQSHVGGVLLVAPDVLWTFTSMTIEALAARDLVRPVLFRTASAGSTTGS